MAHPANFLDVRGPIIAGGTGAGQDAADLANDVTPASLRADDIHLLTAGYAIPAQACAGFINARGSERRRG